MNLTELIEKAVEDMPALSPALGKTNRIAQEMETSLQDLVKIIIGPLKSASC